MRSFLFVVAFLFSVANAHMWLRTPLSRGGVNNIGSTTGQCAGLSPTTGTVTTYEVGDTVNFQFRVNQHGPQPFKFALSTANDVFSTVLVSNIANNVTAGPDGFDGVNVKVTIPNMICDNCAIQLSGMGTSTGTNSWYNCANVKILAAGSITTPKPSAVSPTQGPTTGNTAITVTGTNFGDSTHSAKMKCRFDTVIVAATYVSTTSVHCNSPPRNQPSSSAVEVSNDNGATFSATGTVYTFTGSVVLPVINSISPTNGKAGDVITVSGNNFFSPAMQCKFGPTVVQATYISATQATCVVPTSSATTSQAVPIEVNVDGSAYSQSGLSFTMGTSNNASIAGLPFFTFVVAFLVYVFNC